MDDRRVERTRRQRRGRRVRASSTTSRRTRRSSLSVAIRCERAAPAACAEARSRRRSRRRCARSKPSAREYAIDRDLERAVQPVGAALGGRPAHAGRRTRRTGRIRTPACPGSARRSAATASSPRCRRSWVNPRIARGVLEYPGRDAGRRGRRGAATPSRARSCTRRATARWRALGEVPFGRYYGSVDATPLFVMLAGAYYERTGDRAFLATHLAERRARARLDRRYGDRDGDGFVEYARHSPTGLVQQGWKDSQDSVFHADGTLARGADRAVRGAGVRLRRAPARRGAGRRARPRRHRATQLRQQAEALRGAFEERFWCEDDRHLRARARRAQAAVPRAHLERRATACSAASPRPSARGASPRCSIGADMFSGWGVRTIAAAEARYNPMSYHNGSVWPHDNGIDRGGLLALRLRRSGRRRRSAGLFEASGTIDGHRLPELFCGFHRRPGEGPTLYPVACSPQAWASGVVFHLIAGVSAALDRRAASGASRSIGPFSRRFSPTSGC